MRPGSAALPYPQRIRRPKFGMVGRSFPWKNGQLMLICYIDKSTEPFQGKGGSMLHDRNGQSVVEYIVVLAIFITLVGGALWNIFTTLQVKFNNVNVEIGS